MSRSFFLVQDSNTNDPIKPTPGISPFLSLPNELRREIYCAALTRTHPVSFASRDSGTTGRKRDFPCLGVNLLRVCWQVYREAHELVYSENTFELWPQSTLTTDKFLEAISKHPENARLVQRLEIIVDMSLFHHNDYILWPRYNWRIPFDLKQLEVVIAILAPECRIQSDEDPDDESVHAEVEMEDMDETPVQYDLREALWRATDYLYTTMFNGDDDADTWFHVNQDVVAWDDGGDEAVTKVLDSYFSDWRPGRTEWGRSRVEKRAERERLALETKDA